MSILERRMLEMGRIRVGDKVPVSADSTTTRPRRLETFRFTSQNKPRLEYMARLPEIGGVVTPWPDAPQGKQWQLYSTTDTLAVVVPPFNALTQNNEIWQGRECRVRCDGEYIIHSTKPDSIGTPCVCANLLTPDRIEKAKQGKACHTITRLNLILPDVPGVGVWRFETGSYYAGMELQGCAEMMEAAAAEGTYITCALQIEERKALRRNTKGVLETQVFVVVTLQPTVTMRQLLTRQIPADALVGQVVPKALPSPEDTINALGGGMSYAPPAPQEDSLGRSAADLLGDDPDVLHGFFANLNPLVQGLGLSPGAILPVVKRRFQVDGWPSLSVADAAALIELLKTDPQSIRQAVQDFRPPAKTKAPAQRARPPEQLPSSAEIYATLQAQLTAAESLLDATLQATEQGAPLPEWFAPLQRQFDLASPTLEDPEVSDSERHGHAQNLRDSLLHLADVTHTTQGGK